MKKIGFKTILIVAIVGFGAYFIIKKFFGSGGGAGSAAPVYLPPGPRA